MTAVTRIGGANALLLAAFLTPLAAAQPARQAVAPVLGAPLPAATLAASRGTGSTAGRAIVTTIGGTVAGNSASHLATGNNIIQSGSFADASGMPLVIQNSGANVLIQNATVIHLEMK